MKTAATIKHRDMFIPLVGEKILVMPQGGPIQYRTEFEAERHARLYIDGYTGGALTADAEDVI